MKVRMKKFIIPILILICSVSLCFAADEDNKPQPATMQIHKGELFTITLRANSTTGYQWQFAKPLDETMLQLVNSEYKPYARKRLGAEGKQLWTFKAFKAGEVIISLKYVRAWEQDAAPQKETSFRIIIK